MKQFFAAPMLFLPFSGAFAAASAPATVGVISPVDGMIGSRTLAALNAFLKTQGNPKQVRSQAGFSNCSGIRQPDLNIEPGSRQQIFPHQLPRPAQSAFRC